MNTQTSKSAQSAVSPSVPSVSSVVKVFPEGVLESLIAKDFKLAISLLRLEARRQNSADWMKFRDIVRDRIESEFDRITGRQPYAKSKSSDIRIYRERIAYYCARLGVKYLIDDIRNVGSHAQSLKYFIVPSINRKNQPDRAARWEIAWTDKVIESHKEQAKKWIEEDAKNEALYEKSLEPEIPEWLQNSVDLINIINNRLKSGNSKNIYAEKENITRIVAQAKFHGYQITIDQQGKASATLLEKSSDSSRRK